MAKFKFRLQKVLEMRTQREQLLQRQYNELRKQAELEKMRLLKLIQDQETAREELSAKQRGTIAINEVMDYLAYLEVLKHDIERQTVVLREAEERAEEARQELLRASQEKKAVEKLKEKQFEEFQKEQQRLEVVFLDEVSSSRYNRQQADSGGSQSSRRPAPGARSG